MQSNDKKGKVSIKVRLLALTLIPLILVGLVTTVIAGVMIRSGMEDEVLEGLASTAKFYRDIKISEGADYAESELEDKLDDILEAFRIQLKPDEIIVEKRIAMIAVVGRRMKHNVGVSARICKALADSGINIRMLNQGTNEINVIVGVEADDFEQAIRVIYNEFVGA